MKTGRSTGTSGPMLTAKDNANYLFSINKTLKFLGKTLSFQENSQFSGKLSVVGKTLSFQENSQLSG